MARRARPLQGSALGFAWHFVMPLSQIVVFWILFGVPFGLRPRTETGELGRADGLTAR